MNPSEAIAELLYRAVIENDEFWFEPGRDIWSSRLLRARVDRDTLDDLLFVACLRRPVNRKIVKFLLHHGADIAEVRYASLISNDWETLRYAVRKVRRRTSSAYVETTEQ